MGHAARSQAKGVVRDMTRTGGTTYYAGWIVNITKGERDIGGIPFQPEG